MAKVSLCQVTKTFAETTAVRELSVDVKDGEFFILLGPTGAGKTTSLRLIAGLETPDEGTVSIGGRDVTGISTASRDVTFVFQQYSLYPNYTVYENLAFPLKAPVRRMGSEEIKRRAAWVGDRLGIASKFNNQVTELSGGEMQRVALGRALMRQPAVHLMDEPLSSLDAKLRESLRSELKGLQAEIGTTIIYVTHDQSEALALGDRVAVLSDGELLQLGAPEEIYMRPNSELVAKQLGSPAINIVPPEVLNMTTSSAATIGLRPEDVILADPNQQSDSSVFAFVQQVERLGAENTVILQVGEITLHALSSCEQSVERGDKVAIRFMHEDLLFFDRDGRRTESADQ